MTKYMVIQVKCEGMTAPADAEHTDITEAAWQKMSEKERDKVIAEGAWNIIDAWAVARED